MGDRTNERLGSADFLGVTLVLVNEFGRRRGPRL